MKNAKLITWVIGLALLSGPAMIASAQEGPWEPVEPQGQWSHAWHSGFRDGVDAARHDIDAGRPPDPRHHDKFRHPDIPRDQRDDFREGFRRGYNMVYEHRMHDHDRDHDRDHHDYDDHPHM